jgi:hypothetical protein
VILSTLEAGGAPVEADQEMNSESIAVIVFAVCLLLSIAILAIFRAPRVRVFGVTTARRFGIGIRLGLSTFRSRWRVTRACAPVARLAWVYVLFI